jgi:RsiW-degrading membrane proteinase PrsW (M82 family)
LRLPDAIVSTKGICAAYRSVFNVTIKTVLMVAKLFIVALFLLPFYGLLLYLITRKKCSYFFGARAFLFGCLSTIPLILSHEFHLLDISKMHLLFGVIIATFVLAAIEELCKKVAEHGHEHFYSHPKGILKKSPPVITWIGVGLGFAYLENVIYITEALAHADVVSIVMLRLLFGTLAHTVFTSLGGYLSLGAAKTLFGTLKGFVGASISHSIFNVLNYYRLSFLIVPLIAFSVWLIMTIHKRYYTHTVARGDPLFRLSRH